MRHALVALAFSGFAAALPVGGPSGARAEAPAAAAEAPKAMWLADFAAMQQLAELGDSAMESKNYADAAAYFEQASELSAKIPSPAGIYASANAAAAYLKMNRPKDALRLLEKAAAEGVREADYFATASDFEDLHGNKRFARIIEKMRGNAEAFRNSHRRAEDAKLIFDDVERFWAAYDLAAKEKGLKRKAAIFREHYLAPGTPGLIDYHWIKIQSMEQLASRIEEIGGYYDGVRERTLGAEKYGEIIREGLRRFVALYPDASVPDVTFVIGRLSSGGTAGPSGMLIGLDVWSWTEGVPLDGVEPGFQKAVQSFNLESLPFIVVHEHIHALQQYSGETNVLRGSIQEGSADFLASLALPEQQKPHYYRWGLEREEMIWRRFQKEMEGENFRNWLGNNSNMHEEDWYADLGYFIGARISEAYYEQAEDKQQAIRDLLFVTDAQAILDKGGYASRFAN